MIIPSIDIQGGKTVQLIGGEVPAIDAGDPEPLAEKFCISGEVALIDLDAAMGSGSNSGIMEPLLRRGAFRVGGGIRSYEDGVSWLDAGAGKIILGTAATPDLLARFPRERTVAAVDARSGNVVVEGWKRSTGSRIEEKIIELREYVGGFLVTFVEREGRLLGIDLEHARRLKELAGDASLTVAGGVSSVEEIAALDEMGIDAQVGMAIYNGTIDLADAIAAPLIRRDPEGLWPTVVSDTGGVTLGLAWSDRESLREAVSRRQGVYHSRRRGLWVKGETSGNTQDLLGVRLDCDRDTLQFIVRQRGDGFCHAGTYGCFGNAPPVRNLWDILVKRRILAPEGSYTKRLFEDPALLNDKIVEEAGELAAAESPEDVRHEAADILYFMLVKMVRAGVGLEDLEGEILRKSLKVTRRPGDSKG